MLEPELNEHDYLQQIELLARDVVRAAKDEGWVSYDADPAEASALQRAVNEVARRLRHWHFNGDGCLEDDRPLLHLGGAGVITPGDNPERQENYRTGCARLGVDVRDEGWALWYSWDDKARAHTIVTTALDTTHALLDNWSHGRDIHPAQPDRAQIAAVVRGWVGPITLSPSHATTIGLGGR
ncbi:hypothetical protein [Krasilnikovia sp. MM14-A1259]|uniref:hypothetical protein n=1 Tax=Krasilnikovia sp. MM14-A1259 TaxID=3373539 RepID=UPI00399C5410